MALLDITALKAKIDNWITTNGNREITGTQMNELLKDIIDSGPNFIDNSGSIGLADYVATEIYNESDEGQCVVFGDDIYQAKPGETNITGAFDPLKWDLRGSAGGGVESVNGDTDANIVLDADDISDAATINKYATQAELDQIASNALDISNLAVVASSGDYNDLSNLPILGTAASNNTGDFATAAQGTSADNAEGWGDHSLVGYITSFENISNAALTFDANRTVDFVTYQWNMSNTRIGMNKAAGSDTAIDLLLEDTYGIKITTVNDAVGQAGMYLLGTGPNDTAMLADGIGGSMAYRSGVGINDLNYQSAADSRTQFAGGLFSARAYSQVSINIRDFDIGMSVGSGRATTGDIVYYGEITGGTNHVGLQLFSSAAATTPIGVFQAGGNNYFNSIAGGVHADARTGYGIANGGTLSARVHIKAEAGISGLLVEDNASGADIFEVKDDKTIIFNGLTVAEGTGTPEAVVTAPVGSFFLRSDGGASTTLYIKESGAGNTGWVAK